MVKSIDLTAVTDEKFPHLYRDRIEPLLGTREADRLKAVSVFWRRGWLGAGAALLLVGPVQVWTGDIQLALFLGAVALIAAGSWAYAPVHAVGLETKKQALSAIAEAMDCTYQLDGVEPAGLEQLRTLQLLATGDRARFHDHFAGHHHGCSFTFCDGHVEQQVRSRRGKRWVTMFRGQVIQVDFPKRFRGTTVIHRDAGMLNFLGAWANSLQRVGLVDGSLEKAFEIYATDQVEARDLIHPVFMERLLELEQQFKGKNLRCAFTQGKLLIVIEGGDRFELGSMFKTLLDEARIRQVLRDISEIVKIIDSVLTAERGALPS